MYDYVWIYYLRTTWNVLQPDPVQNLLEEPASSILEPLRLPLQNRPETFWHSALLLEKLDRWQVYTGLHVIHVNRHTESVSWKLFAGLE